MGGMHGPEFLPSLGGLRDTLGGWRVLGARQAQWLVEKVCKVLMTVPSFLQDDAETLGYLLGVVAALGSWATRIPPLSRIVRLWWGWECGSQSRFWGPRQHSGSPRSWGRGIPLGFSEVPPGVASVRERVGAESGRLAQGVLSLTGGCLVNGKQAWDGAPIQAHMPLRGWTPGRFG